MAAYITLFRWTEQGVQALKQLGQRISDAEKLSEQLGGKLKDVYVVMGRYDVVTITEAPDDETATKINLAIAMKGNSRSETLRAYGRQEIERLIAGLP